MTSNEQVEANRRNAQHSTGPKTEEGKAASAMNALKHGLTATTPVLPTEDPDDRARFRDRLLDDLAPVGALEERLAEEVLDLSWRLRRATNLELGVLARGVASADERFYAAQKAQFEVTERNVTEARLAAASGLNDDVIQILNPDVHEFLGQLVDEAVEEKRSEAARLGEAFIDDAAGPNAIAKLARHETALFRRRNQALDALASAQNARAAINKETT
jgi:hypothetical protein